MSFPEYPTLDATDLAALVSKGEVTAAELVDEAIARIERHNPELNAVVHRMDEEARATARAELGPGRDGPLRGVPMVLKDLLGDYAGVPTTSGSRFLRGHKAVADSELVMRYKRSGLIAVAKTNAPELGLLPTTEPHAYGPTRNPWNTAHSTGGSSGGSAACVAAGIVPVGHANDGGGSIRIPASCCGLVGLKPTRGRNPLGPLLGDVMSGLVAEHVVTRSVRDSALVLDCTAGPDIGDPYWPPPAERLYEDEIGRDPGTLRVAFWKEPFGPSAADPECQAAVDGTARLLADLGHQVEEAMPPVDAAMITDAFLTVWAAGCAATIEGLALTTGRKPEQGLFEPMTWAFYQRGQQVTAARYMTAITMLQLVGRQMGRFFEDHDVWLTPTLGAPPIALGVIDGNETDVEKAMALLTGYVPYTPVFNATGQPAISLPLHESAAGLPVGVHLAGRLGDEGTLLCLAAQLEQARPWADRRPQVWG